MKNKSQVRMLPLPSQGDGDAAPTRPTVEETDPAQSWLDSHPAGETFDATQPESQPAAQEAPAPEAVASDTPADHQPQAQAEPAAHDAAPAAPSQPPAVPQASDTPAAATSAASQGEPKKDSAPVAEPVRLALEGEYLVADGAQPWTGAQVIEGLRERATLEPRAKEADGFREFFGADLEATKAAWTPMIDALRAHPERIRFLEDALEHMPDDKFEYLLNSSQFWDTQRGTQTPDAEATPPAAAGTAPQKYAQIDPQLAQRLENFEKFQAQQEAERQWNAALGEFPILRERADLRNSLIELFNAMYKRDPSTTLEDALRINRPMYQAIVVALGNEQPAAQPTPVVPALNGSPGAAPAATRQRSDGKAKAFKSLDDGVEDWLRSHPQ